MSAYSEKLKDPRWQKKRLTVLERDKWQCQSCFATTKTLHVHHKAYLPNKEPWDCPDWMLVALCEECHEWEGEGGKDLMNDLVSIVKRLFWSDQALELVPELALAASGGISPHRLSAVMADAIRREVWGSYDDGCDGDSAVSGVSTQGGEGGGHEGDCKGVEEVHV